MVVRLRSINDRIRDLKLISDASTIDYIIKIVGGALAFALLAIALRRKFERRFRH